MPLHLKSIALVHFNWPVHKMMQDDVRSLFSRSGSYSNSFGLSKQFSWIILPRGMHHVSYKWQWPTKSTLIKNAVCSSFRQWHQRVKPLKFSHAIFRKAFRLCHLPQSNCHWQHSSTTRTQGLGEASSFMYWTHLDIWWSKPADNELKLSLIRWCPFPAIRRRMPSMMMATKKNGRDCNAHQKEQRVATESSQQ